MRRLLARILPARILPDSVAARVALTVILALVLAQAVSALVYLTDRREGPPVHSLRVLVDRVAAITQLVETTPPADRPRVVRALDDPVLGVAWRPDEPRFRNSRSGFPFEILRRRVRAALADPVRPVVIETRRDRHPLAAPHHADEPAVHGDVRVSVALADGSWLQFTTGDPAEGPFRLIRFALWMAGIGLVITLLSLWAARRLTAPLARFAAAAERLGVDADAPALPEAGPKELRAATAAFNTMQERLQRFVADRTQMLAAISHDLRTPLTRLRLRAELVEDEEIQRRMLADLDEMEAMIRATLAFARDDAKRERREPLDLAALLQSLVDDRTDAGLKAAYAGPEHCRIEGRPVALRRAFANLIDNAIAYGGAARVTLAVGPGGAVVDVEDDGPGIPEADLERVFAPFVRLDPSRSRDTGGVGLGLSTARTILHGHGGSIALANRSEGGLGARVELPGPVGAGPDAALSGR